jgi:hypothetical protein
MATLLLPLDEVRRVIARRIQAGNVLVQKAEIAESPKGTRTGSKS